MKQVPQTSEENNRRWFYRAIKSPSAILVDMSRKIRELARCGGGVDWQDEEIAKDYTFRPRHRQSMGQATTWEDLLLGLEDDAPSSETRVGEDKHENDGLVVVGSPSGVVEVPNEILLSPPKITRIACEERRARSIDKVVRRLDPYDCNKSIGFDAFHSSYEDSSSLEYSEDDDDEDDDDETNEHWC